MGKYEKCSLFIDESGCISKNNGERYFCIGGYLIESGNKKHEYKMIKIIKNVLRNRNHNFKRKPISKKDFEVKFSNIKSEAKSYVYDSLKKLPGKFVGIIVDKSNCDRLTEESLNDYYNYLVKILIGYTFDICKCNKDLKFKELNLYYDNRSMKISANNDLQTYLIDQFKIKRSCKSNQFCCNFNVKERNSKVNYGIMVSDFIAGICWARYNYPSTVNYGQDIKISYLSKFPYNKFGKSL